MAPPVENANDLGWSNLSIAWFLLWPGWLVGVTCAQFVPLNERGLSLLIFAVMATGQYLRTFFLPRKAFERFQVAVVRQDQSPVHTIGAGEALRVAARLVMMQGALLMAMWGIWFWIDSPSGADRVLLRQAFLPWLFLFPVGAQTATHKPYSAFRLEMIPRNRVP